MHAACSPPARKCHGSGMWPRDSIPISPPVCAILGTAEIIMHVGAMRPPRLVTLPGEGRHLIKVPGCLPPVQRVNQLRGFSFLPCRLATYLRCVLLGTRKNPPQTPKTTFAAFYRALEKNPPHTPKTTFGAFYRALEKNPPQTTFAVFYRALEKTHPKPTFGEFYWALEKPTPNPQNNLR